MFESIDISVYQKNSNSSSFNNPQSQTSTNVLCMMLCLSFLFCLPCFILVACAPKAGPRQPQATRRGCRRLTLGACPPPPPFHTSLAPLPSLAPPMCPLCASRGVLRAVTCHQRGAWARGGVEDTAARGHTVPLPSPGRRRSRHWAADAQHGVGQPVAARAGGCGKGLGMRVRVRNGAEG